MNQNGSDNTDQLDNSLSLENIDNTNVTADFKDSVIETTDNFNDTTVDNNDDKQSINFDSNNVENAELVVDSEKDIASNEEDGKIERRIENDGEEDEDIDNRNNIKTGDVQEADIDDENYDENEVEDNENEIDIDNDNDNDSCTGNDTGNDNDNEDNGNETEGSENTVKRRMMACKRCHSLKVKCVPVDPSNKMSNCKRCSKKGLQCEFNFIIKKKKRQIPVTNTMKLKLKNDEIKSLKNELLEKDKLIKLLRGFTDNEESKMTSDLSPQERLNIYNNEIKELEDLSSNDKTQLSTSQFVMNSEKRVQICENEMSSLDIIGSGILTYSQCFKLLDIFIHKIHPKYPLIDLPSNLSMDYLRNEQPLLFAIMVYIAIIADTEPSNISVDSQLQLECLISKSISLEILLIGNKNIQLLKNTLLYCIWYVPPELFHHRRYHMFASLCVSMAHDLGISGRPYFFYNKDDGSVKKALITGDSENLDLKALVLVVYMLYMSISLFLKRIVFLQWSDYLNESCILLENTNKRSYKLIVLYARLNHLMEIIYTNVHRLSEQLTVLELSNIKNKLQMVEYINHLNNLKQNILNNFNENSSDYHLLMSYVYSVQAYLYEPALQTLIKSKEYITPEYANVFFSTLSQICESCLLSLKHFNELSIEEMTINPLFHTSRILYTSGMLLRIRYLSLTIPKSGKSGLFTDECISTIKNLLEKFDECEDKYPKNHFIKKIKIVLCLFIHTCLNQWNVSYKSLYNQIRKDSPLFPDPRTYIPNKRPKYHSNNDNINNINNRNQKWPNLNIISTPNNNSNNNTSVTTPSQSIIDENSINNTSGRLQIPNPSDITSNNLPYTQPSPPTPILRVNSNSGSVYSNSNHNSAVNTPVIKFSPVTNYNSQIPLQAPNNLTYSKNLKTNPINNNNNNNNTNNNNTNNNSNSNGININANSVMDLENSPDMNILFSNNNDNANNQWSENQWEVQYRAFNDEFWSDLFFGDGDTNNINETNIRNNRNSIQTNKNIYNEDDSIDPNMNPGKPTSNNYTRASSTTTTSGYPTLLNQWNVQ